MSTTHVGVVAFQTILSKEIRRFMRIWTQTILPPAITMSLYLVIFPFFSVNFFYCFFHLLAELP